MPRPIPTARSVLRTDLLARRADFMDGPLAESAAKSLLAHLSTVLAALEPQCLGLYWAQRSEFNAVPWLLADTALAELTLALPFAEREPVRMHYRQWMREPPTLRDGCGLPTSSGPKVVPDVAIVPCVGFTDQGFRLGYGGGYFDRWLAAHPHVTTVGVAWSGARVDEAMFEAQSHDLPLSLIVTEQGVV